jgi:ABC-2 type transport system permease protein
MLSIYRAYLSVNIATHLQYRAMLFFWLISTPIEAAIMLVVWSMAAGGGALAGYAAADFAVYYIALLLTRQITASNVMWIFDHRIRYGLLTQVLMRPVQIIHHDIAQNLVIKGFALLFLLPAVSILALLFGARLESPPWAWGAFVCALLLAIALTFILRWMLGLLAFWTTQIRPVISGMTLLEFFLGGQIAPLALLPSAAQQIAAVLPFRWMIAFPIDVLMGRISPEQVAAGLLAQTGWIIACSVGAALLWRAGVRRYSAVGG